MMKLSMCTTLNMVWLFLLGIMGCTSSSYQPVTVIPASHIPTRIEIQPARSAAETLSLRDNDKTAQDWDRLWMTPSTCEDIREVNRIRKIVIAEIAPWCARFKTSIEVHGPLPVLDEQKDHTSFSVPDVYEIPNWKLVLNEFGPDATPDNVLSFGGVPKEGTRLAFRNEWRESDQVYGVVLRATQRTVGGFLYYLHVRKGEVIEALRYLIVN